MSPSTASALDALTLYVDRTSCRVIGPRVGTTLSPDLRQARASAGSIKFKNHG
jgi:hypothetical protein